MKAAVYYGPNKVEVADVPEPSPGPGTVKVQVGFNGICGTDLHEYYAGPIGIGLWFALRGKGVEDTYVVEPSDIRRAAIGGARRPHPRPGRR